MNDKLVELLKSRKFWSLVASVAAIAGGYFSQGVNLFDSLQLLIAALAAYSVATGIESRK